MTDSIVTRLRGQRTNSVLCEQAADEIERLRAAIQKIEQAIVEEGKMPPYHRSVMKRHRMEWGTLHNAIDEAIEAVRNG
jgi:hypothetical protein